jgi:AraC-like DNA-binding protein
VPDRRRTLPVPTSLTPWVAEISLSTIDAGSDGRPHTVIDLPDAATALAVRSSGGGYGDVMVMGPRTRALYHAGEPGPSCLQLRIQPGRARPVVGLAVRELVDRVVPLGDEAGAAGDRLARELAGIGADPDSLLNPTIAARLERALLETLAEWTRGDRVGSELVHDATRLLSSGGGPEPKWVRVVARRLNVSERQLRNVFSQAVGLSPKQYVRIDRVRTVLANARRGDLAQVATRAGYYDQSHMAAEFRRLMGVPPGAFVAGRLPAASPCRRQPG